MILLAIHWQASGAVLISEFLASNSGGLLDQDGETPGWIEIHNDSTSDVNLAGWHLTDSVTNLTRWTFPSTNLPPDGYIIVFASGKDRAISGAELHANFQLHDGGEHLALVEPDGATIAHQYSPMFPPQRANVSYGIGRNSGAATLIPSGAAARYFAPTNGTLGYTWTAINFDDSAWAKGPTGLGYDSNPSNSTSNSVVLNIDFNDDDSGENGAANTEAGFDTMTLSSNPATFNGISVSLSAIGGGVLDDRDRPTPTQSASFTQDQLYDDFIFVNGQTNGNGMRINITGLPPNQDYYLTVWCFDSSSPGSRVSDWIETASGTTNVIVNGFTFNGSVPPVSDGEDTINATVHSSLSGSLQIEARRNGGTSHGVFLNALRLAQASYRPFIGSDVSMLMSNRTASIYTRLPFVIENASAVNELNLRVNYDDGFAAYLNGQLVAKRNSPASPQWNSTATAAQANSAAIVAEDVPITIPVGLLQTGTNILAIHGLNLSLADNDFLLLPVLQDVSVNAFQQLFFTPPTPGAANGTGYAGFVADTKFSADRGYYDAPFNVSITSATPGAEIRWTLDGSPPGPANGSIYSVPIAITNTAFLRAAAFAPNLIPTDMDTHTYIFLNCVLQQSDTQPGCPTVWDAGYPADYAMDTNVVNNPAYGPNLRNDLLSIPALSIVTEQDGLWGSSRGIYNHALNSGDAWERAASIELINSNNTTSFAVNCGLRMQGNASRDNVRTPKHAFRLLFKSDYGPSRLNYDWFPDSDVHTFDNIVLRACFTDSWPTRSSPGDGGARYRPDDSIYIRDIWVKDCMRDMGWLASHCNFVHLYINGLYWGLYDPCERLDASYFASHVGGNKADWDVIRDFSEVLDGSKAEWTSMINTVNAGITNDAAYQAVGQLVDIDNLIDYMMLHIFAEAEDWPQHNWYAAHRRATNGAPATRWIFLSWDQEIALDRQVRRNRIDVNNDDTPARIYSQLRAYPEFRVRFGDRIQKYLFNGGVLSPERNVARLMARAAQVDRAIVGESARWGDAREFAISPNPGTGITFTRDEWWAPELQKLYTNYLQTLNTTNIARFRAGGLYPALGAPQFNQFGGSVPAGFNLALSHTNSSGAIFFTFDGADPRAYGSGAIAPSAQSYSVPIQLNSPTQVRARVYSSGNWSALVEAVFYPPQDLSRLALTELMYNPPDVGPTNGDEFEFIELRNYGTNALNLSGLNFTDGIAFTFTNGAMLEPGKFIVLARNPAAFAMLHPGVPLDGVYSGKLDNSGETVTLSFPGGGKVFSVAYDDSAPWPAAADGFGFSIVPKDPEVSQASDNGSKWRASAQSGGSPGSDDPSPSIPPIVINELLSASTGTDTDKVELHNPAPNPVDVGGWFLTDDPNSPKKFRIPNNSVMPAGGYIVFDETQFNPTPGIGASFSFSSEGESVYLFSGNPATTNLTGYSDGFDFEASISGTSFGRHVNSVGDIQYPAQAAASFAAANSGPRIGPIVINEIHYAPPPGGDEFLELLNISAQSIQLFDPQHPTNTWRLNGIGYNLPAGILLHPGDFLLLVATNPADFRTRFGIATNIQIAGPYSGALDNNGERLQLQSPDSPDTNALSYITIDEVRYDNKFPWPSAASSTGFSLQRIASTGYGNDPANWFAAVPTPGQLSSAADSDGDGLPDVWESGNHTNPNLPDANDDPDHDGMTNLQEYLAGTDPQSSSAYLRVESLSLAENLIHLQFLAVSNRTYSVVYADSLSSTNWNKLLNLPSATTNRIETVTDSAPPQTARFYRLVTPALP